MGQTIKYNNDTVELSGNLKAPGNITDGSTSISVANIAGKTHTHGISKFEHVSGHDRLKLSTKLIEI